MMMIMMIMMIYRLKLRFRLRLHSPDNEGSFCYFISYSFFYLQLNLLDFKNGIGWIFFTNIIDHFVSASISEAL